MRRVVDRERSAEKLNYRFGRRFLNDGVTVLESERRHWDNMVTAAEAGVTTRVVTARGLAGGAGASIGQVAGIHLRACYHKQENRENAY